MRLFSASVLVLGLTCLAAAEPPPAPAATPQKVDALIKEGDGLLARGQVNEALAKYREAAALAPKDSRPISAQAELYLRASKATDPQHVEEYRRIAESAAEAAIDLDDRDPMATLVLGELRGLPKVSRHQPNPEAFKAFEAAEAAWGKEDFRGALAHYQEALRRDPAYTDAALYLGDCHFVLKDYAQAEVWFRKATEMEPTYSRPWRFLFDALERQEKWAELEATALKAVAAEPDDSMAWARLRQARERRGAGGLERFRWPRTGRVVPGQDGKGYQVQLDLQPGVGQGDPEGALALAFLLGKVARLQEGPKAKAFPVELKAWEQALAVFRELEAKDPAVGKLKAWAQLRTLQSQGHLDTALFLLGFRPEYRVEFEAWKAKNPKAVAAFVEAFRLRP